MTRGTTPTVTITVTGTTLSEYVDIEVMFRQGSTLVTKTKSGGDVTVSDTTLTCKLTQEETLKFVAQPIKIQARFLTADGMAVASDIVIRSMKDILDESVMTYDQSDSTGGDSSSID